MIEWFDDLKIGMRFKTGETTVRMEDIKRSHPNSIRSRSIWTRLLPRRLYSKALLPRDGTRPPS